MHATNSVTLHSNSHPQQINTNYIEVDCRHWLEHDAILSAESSATDGN